MHWIRPVDHVTPVPVAVVVGQNGTDGNADTKPNNGGRCCLSAICLFHDDHIRAIRGHVNDLRIGRDDFDHFLCDYDRLFVIGLKAPVSRRQRARMLNRFQYISLLGNHRLAELVRPLQVVVHAVEHVGELQQHKDAGVPFRVWLRFSLAVVLPQKPGRFNHVQQCCGCRQDVGDQRVGIKRDWRNQLLQVSRSELDRRRGGGARRRCLGHSLRMGGGGHDHANERGDKQILYACGFHCGPFGVLLVCQFRVLD